MRTPESFLRELVSLPSVYPGADTGGTPAGEAAMAEALAVILRKFGADVETRLLAPGRPSVVATFEPRSKATATVLLAPHLDTVGVQGMTVPPFALTRRGDRLFGRGACDTKGPTAALLWALERWCKRRRETRGSVRWIVAATAGEEQGSLGAQHLMDSGLRADFAVAFEPTGLRVVNAAKGIVRVWIESKGRAAHGSHPERGINAIDRLIPLVQRIPTELAPALAKRPHPVLGRATVNLGFIEGGTGLNVVPDRCRVGLDIRTHPLCRERDALSLIGTLRDTYLPRGTIEVQRTGPSFVTDRKHPWAAALRRQARGWSTANWFSDANLFASFGIPSVAFGPGEIAQAHTKDEYIRRRELEAGGAALLRFLTASPA